MDTEKHGFFFLVLNHEEHEEHEDKKFVKIR